MFALACSAHCLARALSARTRAPASAACLSPDRMLACRAPRGSSRPIVPSSSLGAMYPPARGASMWTLPALLAMTA
eukprot:6161089-Pyramimonas_sp.AAC.1